LIIDFDSDACWAQSAQPGLDPFVCRAERMFAKLSPFGLQITHGQCLTIFFLEPACRLILHCQSAGRRLTSEDYRLPYKLRLVVLFRNGESATKDWQLPRQYLPHHAGL